MNTSNRCGDDLPHKCPIEGCQAAYQKKNQLQAHKKKHPGEKPFVCDESGCSKAYTNKAHLKRHKHVVHLQQKHESPIMCGEKGCGRVLSNKYALKKHHRQIHNMTNYAFTCAHCSQGFQRKRQLKRHIYLHTGEVPFKCSTCNIGFTEIHLYNKHLRNHRTFSCDCGETFARWTLLCAHKRTSCDSKPEYKCIICNKTFPTEAILKRHSLVHTESQRETYRCPYLDCKRSYQYKRNLNYHIAKFHEKLHTEVKCTEPDCEKVLKSQKNLKQHMLAMHSRVRKEKKPRQPRKDKGKPKKCMASIMSGVELPLNEHLAVIKNRNLNRDNVSENTPECNDAIGINVMILEEQPISQNGGNKQSNDMFMSEISNTSNLLEYVNKLETVAVQN